MPARANRRSSIVAFADISPFSIRASEGSKFATRTEIQDADFAEQDDEFREKSDDARDAYAKATKELSKDPRPYYNPRGNIDRDMLTGPFLA